MAEALPSSIAALISILGILSIAALIYVLQRPSRGEPILKYEPRYRVPWGPLVAGFAMFLPLLVVTQHFLTQLQTMLFGPPPITPNQAAEATEAAKMTAGWADFGFQVFFVIAVATWIVAFFRASPRDLGLPSSFSQAVRDIGIGCLATLAALVPIYLIQGTLVTLLSNETKHPLVEQLEANNTSEMLLLGFAMAVIGAPLFEEFTFRCLLQGWLERYEDELLDFEATKRTNTDDDSANEDTTVAETATNQNSAILNPNSELPPHGWIAALPHGWTPILVSGMAFGLAHIGHGVAPITLVFFGMVLGYLYQRTHRLLPSIAAHALFNANSMAQLWLLLEYTPTE